MSSFFVVSRSIVGMGCGNSWEVVRPLYNLIIGGPGAPKNGVDGMEDLFSSSLSGQKTLQLLSTHLSPSSAASYSQNHLYLSCKILVF